MKTIEDLWQALVEDLKLQLSATSISTWFDEVTAVKLEDSTLFLYCPNSFKRDNLERFYLQHIQKALQQRFSADIAVAFLTGKEYAASLPSHAPLRRNALRDRGKFTFGSFVVGDSNRMAFNAAQAVAAGFDEYCNPLIIYGAPGLGKTHLLNAIAATVKADSPDIQVVNIKGDQFTNEMIDAIRTQRSAGFREKYRTVTVFLMDDAQFIAGKKQTQEEFHNTFETLYQNGCSIVLTMDRPPRELNRLDERIASRFEGGLLVEIRPPEYETRLEIVRRKAAERGLALPGCQAEQIAEKVTGSVRKLEGILNKLKAQEQMGQPFSFEQVVEDMTGPAAAETPDSVIGRVADAFRIDPQHIKGKSRSRNVTAARQAAMYILCHEQGLTTTQVGRLLGRDHSTVVYALQTVEEKLRSDPIFANAMKKLMPGTEL